MKLKKKVMLAILAGGMLCMNGAFATVPTYNCWYGNGDNAITWSGSALLDLGTPIEGACTTGANLVLNGEGTYGDIAFADVRYFYGGHSNTTDVTKDVTNNKMTISGGTYTDGLEFYVGMQEYPSGNANYNNLTIENGTFLGWHSFGVAFVREGNATYNTLTIKGGTFGNNTDLNSFYAAIVNEGDNGYVAHNTIEIEGGTFNTSCSMVSGSSDVGNSENNTLIISGGTFMGDGSYFAGGSACRGGAVSSNTVKISGGSFGNDNEFYGGDSDNDGDATGNIVTISGGSFGNDNEFYGGYSDNGNAIGNKLTISGGTFGENNSFYGGEGYGDETTVVDGNIVEIYGGSFNDGYNLYGGYADIGAISSGNILNLKIKMGGKAGYVASFQEMNFTLPSNIAKGETMLSTSNVVYDNTTIGVDADDGVKLNKNDVITLIAADNKEGDISNPDALVLDGAGQISMDGNNLILTMLEDLVTESEATGDKEKSPVEAIAAGMAMINQSADLASNEGLNNLVQNTASGTMDTFGALSANRSKYKTGSHVDMDGWGFLVGAGNTRNWKNGEKTTYGLFFEYGKGEFDTYNNDIHGEGDSNNKGVGIIARHTLHNNTYIDGAIRYGKQETEWNETEIGSYDTDSKYYGFSVGMGHIFEVDNNELDIYGRYTYGHTGSCDAKVGENEYEFDAVKSSRIRFGAKYNFVQQNKQIKPYVGLAWEREMKGESKATITGIGEAPAPSLKGNTGIFEIGCDWEAGKWTLGAGANAYIGKRKGWGGMFNAFYNF